MNNTIKYKYAKDHNQKIVEISTINKHDRNNSQYYCISAVKNLLPDWEKITNITLHIKVALIISRVIMKPIYTN